MNAGVRLEQLAEIEAAIRAELARAVQTPTHEWRVGVLATTDGRAGDARSVVLREVADDAATLTLFTDARSAKVAQVRAHPEGTLVLWSHTLGWQLRLRVTLDVETEGLLVSSAWARLMMTPAAQDYLSPLPPGSPVEHPAPERGSRGHFAVIHAQVSAIDWLELHADGHRRALFDAEGCRWIVP